MTLYYKIKNAIRDFHYDLSCRYQRFKRGYAWSDVWNMDWWFKRTAKPMLIHLRDHGIGVPNKLYLDGAENERAAWEAILTEMVECLELMDEDNARQLLGIADDDHSAESYNKLWDFIEGKKNRLFELFSEHYFSLWD